MTYLSWFPETVLCLCFRIGHIGRLGLADVKALLSAIAKTLVEMNIHISEKIEE
ncbi:MAG: hypothetical protein IPN96_18030 [Anaerolineales bacterium]|nr:hypothetical protein [Anaerolineales bacterium]